MDQGTSQKRPEISIILPCQNEEEALDYCLEQIKKVIKEHGLSAEIIVSDSSTDNSPRIAEKHGVVLVKHDLNGYGRAYLEAFKKVRGKYIFMADADGTYDFKEIPRFIKHLKTGHFLIIGNRFGEEKFPRAMPRLHRYVGNPLLTYFLKLFFRIKVVDSQSGMRAIRKKDLEKLKLRTTGMEFASEMIMKALKNNLQIIEIPVNYHERMGNSKMKSFQDGWRHLRFMLLYSPLFLFFLPGFFLFSLGAISMFFLYFFEMEVLGITFYFHPMFIAAFLIITGYQFMIFALFAKSYAMNHLGEKSPFLEKFFRYFTLEKACAGGGAFVLGGLMIAGIIFFNWIEAGFTELYAVPNFILSLTLLILGIQTVFSAFMVSILSIKGD